MPVIDTESKVRIDFAAGLTEFDKNAIRRKVQKRVGESSISVCSLEDLILYKLFSSLPIDLIDVEELIKHPIQQIDTKYMLEKSKMFVELEREDVYENLVVHLKNYKLNYLIKSPNAISKLSNLNLYPLFSSFSGKTL